MKFLVHCIENEKSPLRIIVTLSADFLSQAQKHKQLIKCTDATEVFLFSFMDRAGLFEVVRGPEKFADFKICFNEIGIILDFMIYCIN